MSEQSIEGLDQILIVEDSPTQAELLRHILECRGYEVLSAGDGAEALSLLDAHLPALVIADIVMPPMNGFELCRQIKADERTWDIPVILLTSLSDTRDVLEGLVCGADNFITKPYSSDYLIHSVERILANRRIYASERMRVGVEILFEGQKRFIAADQQQMLTLLISTYEAAVQRNAELAIAQEELRSVNENLEEMVQQRTAALEIQIAEREAAQADLGASERRYRRLFEAAKDGILILDAETGAVVDANPFLSELLGYPYDQLVGKKIWELGFLKDIASSQAKFAELVQNEYVRNEDLPLETVDGEQIDVEFVSNVYQIDHRNVIQCNIHDISFRVQVERRERLVREILAVLNRAGGSSETIGAILSLIQSSTGLQAVAIRLREGDDFPYFETSGFDEGFVQAERYLCARDAVGRTVLDTAGNPVLECMCGNILCGRTDAARPFFTEAGSFWTNSTSQLLASTSEADRQSRTRNRCNGEGYESVALIPLRNATETIGLLQLNDRRPDRFTLEMIQFFEGLGASIGIALGRERAKAEAENLARFPSEDPAPVLRVSLDGTLRYANEASLSLPAAWGLRVGQEIAPALREAVQQVLQEGMPREVEREIEDRVYSWYIAPVVKAGYVNLYGRDITELKQANVALRESESRWRSYVEHAPYGIFVADNNTRYISVNPEACRTTGYEESELLSMSLSDLLTPESQSEGMQSFAELAGTGQVYVEVEYLTKKGERRWWSVAGAKLSDTQFLGFTNDITARKQAEEERENLQAQLIQAHKMEAVGRLAGGVAHDLNNMLTVIGGYAEMALSTLHPTDPMRDDILEIQKAGQRSAALTGQLLAFARKQTIEPKVLDLNDTISSMLKMLERLIGENIDLLWRPGADLWSVHMDPAQIDQLLTNLMVNARDAITDVGCVTVETQNATIDQRFCAAHVGFVPGEYVVLAVSDDGCGMDKEVLARIFEPFFTTKPVGEGTGLGLATVYGIVKQNGGFIDVYSEPGNGTRFTIYLARHHSAATVEEMHAPGQVLTGTETVLLVEDENALLLLCQIQLEQLGYTVLAAGSANLALELAEQHQGELHLLLTDVVMPTMGGRDLWQRVSLQRPGIKCLFMSGYTANSITHRGVLDEGVHFLQKPFSREALATKVREMLDGA